MIDDTLVLTTKDNPYNPKEDYYNWKMWDVENGYNTEEYIARLLIMETTYDLDDELIVNQLTNKVVNEILENDTLEVYKLV